MDIYYNCPCCEKKQMIIALLIMGQAWKDEMYKCLEKYLATLQALETKEWHPKKVKLLLKLDNFEQEPKKLPKTLQIAYVPPRERGQERKKITIKEIGEYIGETTDSAWKFWASLDPHFKVGNVEDGETKNESEIKARIGAWTEQQFTRKECKEYLEAGFLWDEANLAVFVRDILGFDDPKEILDFMDKPEILRQYNQQKGIEMDDEEDENDDRDHE